MLWDNLKWVRKTPILTPLFLEGANIEQIRRMVGEQTAEGQSIFAWLMVTAALLLWLNFYRVCVPEEDRKWAVISTSIGVVFNLLVVATVVYFRIIV